MRLTDLTNEYTGYMLSQTRIRLVAVFFAALCVLAVGRTLYAQWVDFPAYEEIVSDQQTLPVHTTAPRGRIYDRNGNVLAVSNRAFILRADVDVLQSEQEAERLGTAIAPALGQDPAVLQAKIVAAFKAKNRSNTLAFAVPYSTLTQTQAAIEQYARDNAGSGLGRGAIMFEDLWRRSYPYGPIGGPTVGFITMMSPAASGVEAFANEALAEQPGLRIGRSRIDLIESKPTLSGADLLLTLDVNLQAYVEDRLAQAIRDTGAQSGQIIVMETHTGRILSSGTFPGYDPNNVSELAADPATIGRVRDPAVTDEYEPGSVMKICTLAAALDAGVIRPDELFDDLGRITIEGNTIRNSDGIAHGTVDLTTVLARSLNVVTVEIAQALGPEQFYRALSAFGFGNRTGIDLVGEADGIIDAPTADSWSRHKFATNSFGQSIAVTPYQLINAVNAIGNDGMLMQPFVIQQWIDAQGNRIEKRPVQLQRAISAETARIMRSIMKAATMRATPDVAPAGYSVAGKTGTAQYYVDGRIADDTIVSYVGFLPADNPRVTILIKLDQPTSSTWANKTTIGVFHDVAAQTVRMLGVPPDNP